MDERRAMSYINKEAWASIEHTLESSEHPSSAFIERISSHLSSHHARKISRTHSRRLISLSLSLSRSSLFISHRLSFISHLSIHCKAPCHALSLAQHKLSIARYMQVYYKQTHPSDAPSSRAHTRSRRSWRRDLRAARRTRVSICVERSLRSARSHRPDYRRRSPCAQLASPPGRAILNAQRSIGQPTRAGRHERRLRLSTRMRTS